MDPCQLLNYVILALIVALVIHMVCKAVSASKYAEGMHEGDTCQYPGVFDKYIGPSNEPPLTTWSPAEEHMASVGADEPPSPTQEGEPMNLAQMRGEVGPSNENVGCTVCSTDQSVDDYIRGSLLANAQVCKPRRQFNKEEVEKYKDDFFSFRNSVWQNSNGGDDLVDRINYLYLAGNTDVSRNHKGLRIKDMFDDLVKSTELYGKPCVRMPSVDNLTKDGHYLNKGFRGDSYVRDNWVYGEEKVANGGEFYDDIRGNDPAATSQMAL
jgi:hypothetical protein